MKFTSWINGLYNEKSSNIFNLQKGKQKLLANYRAISIMYTDYKILAFALAIQSSVTYYQLIKQSI